MELFLNLCWLSLLVPAYLLWQERSFSASSERVPGSVGASPRVFLCVLSCVFVLLFPVISATDDLRAARPEMEESERAFRDANRCACSSHALTHSAQLVQLSAASTSPDFTPTGIVLRFTPQTLVVFFTSAPAGRAPPLDRLASV
jgi:hypothetical protein